MKIRFYHQIKWKLTLVILATSAVVLILGGAVVVFYDTLNSRRNLVSQIETMAQITAANSAAALAFQNVVDAQETLDALRARPEIDFAYLCLGDQKPFVLVAREGQEPDFGTDHLPAEGFQIENNKLTLKQRIFFGQDLVGWIVLQANLRQEAARSGAFLRIAVLTLLGLVGMAVLLAARLQRLVSTPISALAATASHITKHKDYSVRVPRESPDEIGMLMRAFNQMLSEIEQQNRSIGENQHQLKLALAAAEMGSWDWDVQANRVAWSVENNPLFGTPSEALSIEMFARRLHEQDTDRVLSAFTEALTSSTSFAIEYRVMEPSGDVIWVAHHGRVRQQNEGNGQILTGIIQNITRRKRTETERQNLVAKLLHAEEEERRRIARELHDTTAQQLAAIKIGLMQARESSFGNLSHQVIPESCALLEQAIQDVRTLTYVLHPPLLEEFGLAGALREFAAGVTRRSHVRVKVNADGFEGRLHRNVELTLFRVVQESIANAIRHSGTAEILVSLARDNQEARVEVQDFGRGLPALQTDTAPLALRHTGVGIAAMEERMTLVGGKLIVESDPEGVTVLASVPITETISTDSAESLDVA
jgi:two-component system NarL family sensor kinase